MSNDISALRQHLFDTLAALKDKKNPMDIARAQAVSDIAQVIINTAKVEVDYARVTGQKGSTFLGEAEAKPKEDLPSGITGITQHRIR